MIILLISCLSFVPVKQAQAKTRAEYALAFVVNTTIATWAWKSTDDHNSGYIRFSATLFTLKALGNFVMMLK